MRDYRVKPAIAIINYQTKKISIYTRKGERKNLVGEFEFYNIWDLTVPFINDLRVNYARFQKPVPEAA